MRYIVLSFLFVAHCVSPCRADEQRPEFLLQVPPSIETVFVAETTSAAFHRFDRKADGGLVYRGRVYMSIGRRGEGKARAGDQRTPLGIYFVTERLDTTRMHEKYGPMAFPLDYPSVWDRRMGRTGDGIWIHGVDARVAERPRLDTDGCLALPNDALKVLEDRFAPNLTPVIVARNVPWRDREDVESVRIPLEGAVENWVRYQEDGDMQSWLALYGKDFRYLGMNRTEWSALQVARVADRQVESVRISDLLLLGDPTEPGLYLSRFELAVTDKDGTVTMTRRLYWRRDEGGALRIVADDAG